MTRQRLTNEQWGFTTNCFVCEPENGAGLRLPFFHDDEREVVVADLELDDAFSGAPSYVHGGISLAVLDEAQSWATIACAGKFAVTTETTSRFRKPVRIGRPYTVEAEVTGGDDKTLTTAGRILDADGETCVETTASFYVLSPAVAADAIGDVAGDDATYLRD